MKEIKVVLGSTFTLGLLKDMTMPIHTKVATWSEVQSTAEVFTAMDVADVELNFIAWGEPVHFHFVNSFGHKSTCDLIEATHGIFIEDNRISLCLDEGWEIVIPQYRGDRLPEGVIELPKGAELVPVRVILSEDEEKIALRLENARLRAENEAKDLQIKEMKDFLRKEGYIF